MGVDDGGKRATRVQQQQPVAAAQRRGRCPEGARVEWREAPTARRPRRGQDFSSTSSSRRRRRWLLLIRLFNRAALSRRRRHRSRRGRLGLLAHSLTHRPTTTTSISSLQLNKQSIAAARSACDEQLHGSALLSAFNPLELLNPCFPLSTSLTGLLLQSQL